MSFEELLARARAGDQHALSDLLAHWRAVIRQDCHRTLGAQVAARADTSDVTQSAILQLWRDLGEFRGKSVNQFKAWTRSIGSGHASKHRRLHLSQKRNVGKEESLSADNVVEFATPEAAAISNEEKSLVLDAVEQLDEQLQFVVLRRFVDDRSLAAIADELGCTYATVRGMYARALQAMKSALQADGITQP